MNARAARHREGTDAFLVGCPSSELYARITDKWVGLILAALADGPRRYGELHTTIDGVSQKMLTQTLRGLEHDGLVSRVVTPTVPVRVDYALTPLGASLQPVMCAIKAWAEEHLDAVQAARARYAARCAATD